MCREEIISRLQDHIVELSTHKFASNVVEKCLQHGSNGQRRKLISTMLGEQSGLSPTDADQLLQTMTKDQYGNYVVQKTLEVRRSSPSSCHDTAASFSDLDTEEFGTLLYHLQCA